MSASVENTPQQPAKKKQRKYTLLLLTVLFAAIGVAYLVYWYTVLRHYQETDDAYVTGNPVQIMPQVSGSVTQVHFINTDYVKSGDVLVSLDPTDAKLALEQAKTALANTVRQTRQLMVNSKELQANIALKLTTLNQAKSDLKRRQGLGPNAISREDLQHAYDAVNSAQAAYDVAVQQYNANQALVLNTPLEQQPSVLQAAAQVRNAWINLQRTQIVSPVTGYVSQRRVQVGAQVAPGTPLMAVVPANQMWIDANFKETQIANMRIGQPVTVTADIYGDSVVFNGKVVGIDMGTGSAFSLLPAQNATGNWIKVVQRLPIRVDLDPQQVAAHPLRIGLSTLVSVDTTDRNGLVLANTVRDNPAYTTDALDINLTPVNQMIHSIIIENAD